MVHNKGSFLDGELQNLTKTEKEVLHMITEEYLTNNQIALRRKCSVRSVQKIVKKLREKGALKINNQKVRFFDGVSEPMRTNQIRLHGEVYHIQILHKDYRYKKLIGRTIELDGNSVRFHREIIIIYSNKSFFGEDTESSTIKSMNYWNRFIPKLENNANIILQKSGSQNIKRTKQEYAYINNGLAKKCEKEAQKIKIHCKEDGKVWFLIDNSFNLHEAECVHSETSQFDMQESVEPFFNGLRNNRGYTPDFVLTMLGELIRDREYYAKNLKSHVKAIQRLGVGVENLRNELKTMKNNISQKKLGDYL